MPFTTISRAVATVAVLGLCAAAASCSSLDGALRAEEKAPAEQQAPVPRSGGRLVFGLEADPNGLDPTRNAWDNAGIQLANALYDPLTAFDAEGQPQPYLAESLTPNADFTSWTVKLRPGVTFHDGKPLDAQAAVVFFQALRDSIVTGPPAQNISGLRAIDDLSFEVTMHRPWATLPALVAGQGGYIVSVDQLTDAGGKDGRSNPIGTGPFMLRSWTTDAVFELVRNPRYWRPGLPYLDAVEFAVTDRGRDRLDRIRQGTMDATAVTRLDDVQALEEELARPQPAVRAEADTSDAEKDTITFNTSKAPLNDARVRRAIAYATDARALAVANDWPSDRAAAGLISPTSRFFSPAPFPTTDLTRARNLVREYLNDPQVKDKPKEIAFTVTAADLNASWLQDLTDQWARVGIKATLNLVPAKQLVRLAVVGTFEVAVLRYFAAEDPDVLWHFFVKDTVRSELSLNFARFRNDALTAAFNDGRATDDLAARRQAYARAQTVLAEQVPHFWINRMEWRMVTSPKVRDARNVTLPDGRPALPYLAGTYRLSETWIDG